MASGAFGRGILRRAREALSSAWVDVSSPERRVLLVSLFLLYGTALAVFIPAGEAPDEPAHLRYIDRLVSSRALPRLEAAPDGQSYELFQPPLDYIFSALVLVVVHGRPIEATFRPSDEFRFDRAGSRAFQSAPASEVTGRRVIVLLRLVRLAWGVGLVLLLCSLASELPSSVGRVVLTVAPAFLLAPQLLAVASAVNNDMGAIFFVSVSLFFAVSLLRSPAYGLRKGSYASVAAVAAVLCKLTGAVLLAPLAVAGLVLWRKGRRAVAMVLCLGIVVVVLSILFHNHLRFGGPGAPFPASMRPAAVESIARLVYEPRWLGGLFRSFWFKVGWLNTGFPLPAYLPLLGPTILVGIGVVESFRRRYYEGDANGVAVVLLSGLAANLLLLLAFMVGVDWQPQGRFLFPSLVPFCFFAGLGIARLERLSVAARVMRGAPAIVLSLAVGYATAGVVAVTQAFCTP